jgi:hypothetical protein
MSYKNRSEGGIYEMPKVSGFFGLLRSLFFMMVMTVFLFNCTKYEDPGVLDVDPMIAAGINKVIPANLADSVEVNPVVRVTFQPGWITTKFSTGLYR